MDAVGLIARFVQYLCASLVLGVPLFHLYGLQVRSDRREPIPDLVLLRYAAAGLMAGEILGVAAQSAAMMGRSSAFFDTSAWGLILSATHFGHGLLSRMMLTFATVVFLIRSRGSLTLLSVVAAFIMATFAWTGHGGDGEGAARTIHMMSDIAHLWTAAVWIGAVVVLARLAMAAGREPAKLAALKAGLRGRFSGFGPGVVAVLVITGVVNTLVLARASNILTLPTNAWGRTLLVKLALAAAMLVLAALNRWRLAPKLAAEGAAALPAQAASLVAETVLGLLVLGAVSYLGTLPPPSAL